MLLFFFPHVLKVPDLHGFSQGIVLGAVLLDFILKFNICIVILLLI